MEHRNSTGLIFRCFAIFYGIFLAILLISMPILSDSLHARPFWQSFHQRCMLHAAFIFIVASLFILFYASQQLCSVSLQVVQLYQTINDFRQFYLYQRQVLSFLCYGIDFLDCGTFHCAPNANLCSAIVYADDLTKLVVFLLGLTALLRKTIKSNQKGYNFVVCFFRS